MSDFEQILAELNKITENLQNDSFGELEIIMSMEEKRKTLLERLNDLPELSIVSDVDIEKFVALYEQRNKDKKDIYDSINKIEVQTCLYEVIKDNEKYQQLIDKLVPLYEKQLSSRLTKDVYDDGAIMNQYQLPYSQQQEYSMVLADMYANQMKNANIQNDLKSVEKAIESYEKIKADMLKAGISMNPSNEEVVLNTTNTVNQIKKTQEDERKRIVQEHQDKINQAQNIKNQIEKSLQATNKYLFNCMQDWNFMYRMTKSSNVHMAEYGAYSNLRTTLQQQEQGISNLPFSRMTDKQLEEYMTFSENALASINNFYALCEQTKKETDELPLKLANMEQQKKDMLSKIDAFTQQINNLINQDSTILNEESVKKQYQECDELKQKLLRNDCYRKMSFDNLWEDFNTLTYQIELCENALKQFDNFYNSCNSLIEKKKKDEQLAQEQQRLEQEKMQKEQEKIEKNDRIEQYRGLEQERVQQQSNSNTSVQQTTNNQQIQTNEEKNENHRKDLINKAVQQMINDGEITKKDLENLEYHKNVESSESILSTQSRFPYNPYKQVIPLQTPIQQQNESQVVQNEKSNQEIQENRNKLVGEILGGMIDAGEFNGISNLQERFTAMDNVKMRLEERTTEELERLLSYSREQENQGKRL